MSLEEFKNQQIPQEGSLLEEPVWNENKIGQSKILETMDGPEKLEEYRKKNASVQEEIHKVKENKESIVQQIDKVRNKLYGENIKPITDFPSIDAINTKLEELRLKQIETSSNYPGDWTLLLRDRMLDPITKEKFVKTRTDTMLDMKQEKTPLQPRDGISLIKETDYKEYYQKQIDSYDENVQKIFNSTHIEGSSVYGKEPRNLGKGEIRFPGVVFSDAVLSERELTPREKNIIESHEKGHGLRDFVSSDQRDFRQSVDLDIIKKSDLDTGTRQIGYLTIADEIAERMSQIKNYFGFQAGDVFTKDHLKYAMDNYISDTGLDNNMSVFFKAITDRTIDKFINTINKYPL